MRSIPALFMVTLFLAVGQIAPALSAEEGNSKGADSQQNQMPQWIREIPRDTPIVMLNMLKFRDAAQYPDDREGVTGEEAYGTYRAAASKLVAKVGGGPVWSGVAKAEIIAPEGEEWDEVFLVRYPSIGKFLQMVNSEAYQKIVGHRSAALADSRLIAMVEGRQ